MQNRTNGGSLVKALRRLATVAADFAYGIDAGHAIRHGLAAPPRRARPGAGGRPAAPVVRAAASSR
ncbi:hypothetical protein FHX44_117841 [Pseudonocardia hierapolitana]|uniref:Uncharacterized protein n=1 Tax=Pseudonocardia hierapolitana TaxID=1128676 RepID=A0A561T462_9PSEU|nr:hypothetical protein FHX44_117841 [Pseudonocardia hierapolitana]